MTAPLPLCDTPLRYGRISRALHWSVAMLILFQLAGMAIKLQLGRESGLAQFMVGWHQPVGTVLFVLILLRIVWAVANRRNRPDHGAGLMGMAARLGHLALYAVMLLVPFAALARAWGSDRVFAPFGFALFSAKQPPVGWTQAIGGWHGELGWLLAALIAGHVLMAGLHQAMWRDGTLARMIGR